MIYVHIMPWMDSYLKRSNCVSLTPAADISQTLRHLLIDVLMLQNLSRRQ